MNYIHGQIYFLTGFVDRFFELKNIAKNKPVKLSTVFWSYYNYYSVDGIKSCSKFAWTHFETHAYWRVDLGRPAVVLNVTVLSHQEIYLNPFQIRIGHNENTFHNPQLIGNAVITNYVMKNFTCPEMEGRYVSINLYPTRSRSTRDLGVCEVEVYGIYL